MKRSIPFVDLYAQYLTIKTEIDYVISDVIKNSMFVRGVYVDQFEESFSRAVERKYCISCGNGTDSLYIAMKALGLNPGDEVIVPAHSWISTSETVTQAGGSVVFCDTDPETFTINATKIEEKITSRTVGIIPVHLYGQPADMDEVMRVAEKYNLWVLEDCAQAHLAKFKGRLVGTFGVAASYSFYPGKNLGAMGDAGALVTNDALLAAKMTMFARHGGLNKGDHQIEGINSRLDGLQAAILTVKLKHLPAWTEARKLIANKYVDRLKGIGGLTLPTIKSNREHVWHLFVVQYENRDELASYLKGEGIQTVINYPIALPFLPAYKRLRHNVEDFPVAYKHQSQILSLPIYPEIPLEHLDYITDKISSFMD